MAGVNFTESNKKLNRYFLLVWANFVKGFWRLLKCKQRTEKLREGYLRGSVNEREKIGRGKIKFPIRNNLQLVIQRMCQRKMKGV